MLGDNFIYFLLLPIIIIPVLFVFGLLKRRIALQLWISFTLSAAVQAIFDFPIASVFTLILSLLCFLLFKNNIHLTTGKKRYAVVVSADSDICTFTCFDGRKFRKFRMSGEFELSVGNIVCISQNNME